MKINTILLLLLVFLLSACGGRNQNSQHQTQTQMPVSTEKSAEIANHPGKKVYDSACLGYAPTADSNRLGNRRQRKTDRYYT